MTIKEARNHIEALDVWVCSFGGCGTNLLSDYLTSRNLVCQTQEWHSDLCHYYTYIPTNKPTIYLYSNPINALKSQKRRNIIATNISKLSNGIITTISDEALIYSMCCQFYNWISFSNKSNNLLFVHYSKLYDNLSKIGSFIGIDMREFPAKTNSKSTKIEIIHENLLNDKYSNFIYDASLEY